MDKVLDPTIWGQHGLAGLVIFALFLFVYYVTKEARQERREWLIAYKEHSAMHDARQDQTNKIIQELTQVINIKLSSEWNGTERRNTR